MARGRPYRPAIAGRRSLAGIGVLLVGAVLLLTLRQSPGYLQTATIAKGTPTATATPVRVLIEESPWAAHSQAALQEWKSTLFGRIANFYKQEEKKASDGGKKEITRVEPWGVARYTPFSPFIGCNGMKMQRLGSSGDGGKMVCMHKELQTPGCVVYSLGSSGNLDFERSVLEATPCEVHTFDCTPPVGKSIDPRHHYHEICVGSAAGEDASNEKYTNFMSWEAITEMLGHTSVDYLKIDIEGSEFDVFSEFKPVCNLPKQIAMEVHAKDMYMLYEDLTTREPVLDPLDFKHLYWTKHEVSMGELGVFFWHLADLGYGVASKEDNMYKGGYCCSEFVFLRVEKPASCT